MKKLVAIILVLALVFSLAACNNNKPVEPVVTKAPATAAPATKAPATAKPTVKPTEAPEPTATPRPGGHFGGGTVGGIVGGGTTTTTKATTWDGTAELTDTNAQTAVTYNGTGTFTSSPDYTGTLTVPSTDSAYGDIEINMPKATIMFHADADSLTAITASTSLHVYGDIDELTVKGGRVVVEDGSSVETINVGTVTADDKEPIEIEIPGNTSAKIVITDGAKPVIKIEQGALVDIVVDGKDSGFSFDKDSSTKVDVIYQNGADSDNVTNADGEKVEISGAVRYVTSLEGILLNDTDNSYVKEGEVLVIEANETADFSKFSNLKSAIIFEAGSAIKVEAGAKLVTDSITYSPEKDIIIDVANEAELTIADDYSVNVAGSLEYKEMKFNGTINLMGTTVTVCENTTVEVDGEVVEMPYGIAVSYADSTVMTSIIENGEVILALPNVVIDGTVLSSTIEDVEISVDIATGVVTINGFEVEIKEASFSDNGMTLEVVLDGTNAKVEIAYATGEVSAMVAYGDYTVGFDFSDFDVEQRSLTGVLVCGENRVAFHVDNISFANKTLSGNASLEIAGVVIPVELVDGAITTLIDFTISEIDLVVNAGATLEFVENSIIVNGDVTVAGVTANVADFSISLDTFKINGTLSAGGAEILELVSSVVDLSSYGFTDVNATLALTEVGYDDNTILTGTLKLTVSGIMSNGDITEVTYIKDLSTLVPTKYTFTDDAKVAVDDYSVTFESGSYIEREGTDFYYTGVLTLEANDVVDMHVSLERNDITKVNGQYLGEDVTFADVALDDTTKQAIIDALQALKDELDQDDINDFVETINNAVALATATLNNDYDITADLKADTLVEDFNAWSEKVNTAYENAEEAVDDAEDDLEAIKDENSEDEDVQAYLYAQAYMDAKANNADLEAAYVKIDKLNEFTTALNAYGATTSGTDNYKTCEELYDSLEIKSQLEEVLFKQLKEVPVIGSIIKDYDFSYANLAGYINKGLFGIKGEKIKGYLATAVNTLKTTTQEIIDANEGEYEFTTENTEKYQAAIENVTRETLNNIDCENSSQEGIVKAKADLAIIYGLKATLDSDKIQDAFATLKTVYDNIDEIDGVIAQVEDTTNLVELTVKQNAKYSIDGTEILLPVTVKIMDNYEVEVPEFDVADIADVVNSDELKDLVAGIANSDEVKDIISGKLSVDDIKDLISSQLDIDSLVSQSIDKLISDLFKLN